LALAGHPQFQSMTVTNVIVIATENHDHINLFGSIDDQG